MDAVAANSSSTARNGSARRQRVMPGLFRRRPAGADKARAADANARFAAVVIPHLDDAYTLARWLTGNRTDAEDVVQDACLRAFRAIDNFSFVNPRGWVLTIVRHAAYSWLRKNRPAELVMVEDLEIIERGQTNRPGTDVETPETALMAKTAAQQLQAVIAALPAPFREALVLRDIQGLSYRDIAAVTEVPVGTVMSRLARARAQIRAFLDGERPALRRVK